MTDLMRRPHLAAVVAGLLVCAACARPISRLPRHPDLDLLDRSWAAYKAQFVAADGRVVRPESGGDTVSEGQAYALLRAAWMRDHVTFDRVWRWTRQHLARPGRALPSLMAWHYDASAGGRVTDWNAATDADTDVALALILAADAWPGPAGDVGARYRSDAHAILRDLIELTALDEAGNRVMLAGEWADHRESGRGLTLNPSYFAPASYRVFAAVTGDSRWLDVARGSYVVLDNVCRGPGAPAAVPDWIRWTSPTAWSSEHHGVSSWDAVRIPWRVGTDRLWFGSAEADRTLAACLTPVAQERLTRLEGAPPRGEPGRVFAFAGSNAELANADHPLTNAMFAFALTRPDERDRMLAALRPAGGAAAFFGEPDRYFVNSLAYLPFLARAGRYTPPRTRAGQ